MDYKEVAAKYSKRFRSYYIVKKCNDADEVCLVTLSGVMMMQCYNLLIN